MSNAIHTIPVPQGMSPEQAWETIQRGDELKRDLHPRWANIETDEKGRFLHLLEIDNDDD
jgi:hypothetical protein